MSPNRSVLGKRSYQHIYPNCSAVIKKIEENKQAEVVLEMEGRNKRLVSAKKQLSPGKYVAFVKINWDGACQKQFITNLACYSAYPCGIYIASFDDAIKFTGNPETKWLGQHYKYIFKKRLHQILDDPKAYKQQKLNNKKTTNSQGFLGALLNNAGELSSQKK